MIKNKLLSIAIILLFAMSAVIASCFMFGTNQTIVIVGIIIGLIIFMLSLINLLSEPSKEDKNGNG